MVTTWLLTGGVLFIALAALGLVLRVAQVTPALVGPRAYYAILTLHGTGMSTVLLATAVAVYWYLVRHLVPMATLVLVLVYCMSLAGFALLVLAAVGGFGAGWTMLYPLPGTPGPDAPWGPPAAAAFMGGFALLVGGFVVWAADFVRAGLLRYGGLGRLLGLDVLRGAPAGEAASPAVIAGTVVAVDGLIGVVPGSLAIALMLANLADPGVRLNALVAKNLLFFSGHILANVPMYLGAGIAYELLPGHVNRPWRASKPLVWGWLLTLGLVMLATFHHLYMDFAEPALAEVIGNVASYGSAFPPIVMTIFTGVSLVHRSGLRWTATPSLLMLAMAAWAIGGYAAVIDSSPWVNQFLHNTTWVVGYFHSLQGLGVIFFLLAGAYHIAPRLRGAAVDHRYAVGCVLVMAAAGWGAVATWLLAGVLGQPRRYPYLLPAAQWLGWLALPFAILAVLAAVAVVVDLGRMLTRRREVAVEAPAS